MKSPTRIRGIKHYKVYTDSGKLNCLYPTVPEMTLLIRK